MVSSPKSSRKILLRSIASCNNGKRSRTWRVTISEIWGCESGRPTTRKGWGDFGEFDIFGSLLRTLGLLSTSIITPKAATPTANFAGIRGPNWVVSMLSTLPVVQFRKFAKSLPKGETDEKPGRYHLSRLTIAISSHRFPKPAGILFSLFLEFGYGNAPSS